MENPFRDSANPGVDETAVRCAKIREDAETKRRQIEECEKTKRSRVPSDEVRVGRNFAWGVGVPISLIIFGVTTYDIVDRYYRSHEVQPPTRSEVCLDNIAMISSVGEYHCDNPKQVATLVRDRVYCFCKR